MFAHEPFQERIHGNALPLRLVINTGFGFAGNFDQGLAPLFQVTATADSAPAQRLGRPRSRWLRGRESIRAASFMQHPVSALPPSWEELTIGDSLGSPTRIKPPGTIVILSLQSM
jgi:hypothetical protein